MSLKFYFILTIILVGLFIYQGTFYRWIGYESKPLLMLDEFSYVWQGFSIRTNGLPFTWTAYPENYEKSGNKFIKGSVNGFILELENQSVDVYKFKQYSQPIIAVEQLDFGEGEKQLSFVAPFFDRPPLGGLILSLGVNDRVQSHAEIKGADLRRVNLVLGVIVSILIFIFTFLITSSPWTGVLSVAIYNTVPTFVFTSRLALGENVGIPLVLIHLILLVVYKKLINSANKRVIVPIILLAGFFGGLSSLAKESLLGFVIGSGLLMIIWKIPKKIIGFFIVSVFVPIVFYIFWGLWIQGGLFLNILLSNIERPFFGSLKFLMILQGLRFQDFPIDGWWIWGFISLFIICFSLFRSYLPLIVPLLLHLVLLIFMGGANYPWYYLALVPFMAISSAIVIWQNIRFPNICVLLTFFFTAISSSFYWGYSMLHDLGNGTGYKLFFLIYISLIFTKFYFAKHVLTNVIWYVVFIFLLYQVVKWNNYSILYFTEHWGNLPVPALPKI